MKPTPRTSAFLACTLLLVGLSSGAVADDEPWVPTIEAPTYFALSVADVDRSVAWYARLFALENLGGSRAEDGSWEIVNLASPALYVEIIRDARDQAVERRVRGIAKVGFGVPDVRVVAERVAKSGAERPRVLDFPEFGIRLLQLRDPDDNIIQISSPLAEDE